MITIMEALQWSCIVSWGFRVSCIRQIPRLS